MKHVPFYHITDDDVKKMFGSSDIRIIKKRIEELGIEIKGKGKNKYIVTDEALAALQRKEYTSYKAKNPHNQF